MIYSSVLGAYWNEYGSYTWLLQVKFVSSEICTTGETQAQMWKNMTYKGLKCNGIDND